LIITTPRLRKVDGDFSDMTAGTGNADLFIGDGKMLIRKCRL